MLPSPVHKNKINFGLHTRAIAIIEGLTEMKNYYIIIYGLKRTVFTKLAYLVPNASQSKSAGVYLVSNGHRNRHRHRSYFICIENIMACDIDNK